MMKYITLWVPPGKAVEVLEQIHAGRKNITWGGGQKLTEYCPAFARVCSAVLYIGQNNKVFHASYAIATIPTEEFSVQRCSDEMTMAAFNLMGQDLNLTANFLWEQGYTQQLIDKLTNGATVEELLLRGDSYD